MPNSILWIGLVVLWVFVLFPMLAGRHPRVRRTTDAALATRVLHRGDTQSSAQPVEGTEFESASEALTVPLQAVRDNVGDDCAADDDEPVEFATVDEDFVPTRRGRGGYDPEADALARRVRYRFRQRTALALLVSALAFGAFAVLATPMLWWGSAAAALLLVVYLVYLRRQVRVEEEIRRRRCARLARVRQGSARAEALADAESAEIFADAEPVMTEPIADVVPAVPVVPACDYRAAQDLGQARALRRRAVILDLDDEDPAFDHLDAIPARPVAHRTGVAGIRQAAGQ